MTDKLTATCRKLIAASRIGNLSAAYITMHPTAYKTLTGNDAGDCQLVATVDGVPVYIDIYNKPFIIEAITEERMKALLEMRFIRKDEK